MAFLVSIWSDLHVSWFLLEQFVRVGSEFAFDSLGLANFVLKRIQIRGIRACFVAIFLFWMIGD